MSAGPITLFWAAKKKIGDGTFDMAGHTFYAMLIDNTQVMTANFTGTSGNCQKSDLTHEVSGTNYTAGGVALTSVTWNQSNGTVTFDAADATWTNATLSGNPKYCVIYSNTASNHDLLCFGDVDTSAPGGTVISSSTFVASWNAAGIFYES